MEFAGSVDVWRPDPEHFTVCCGEPNWHLYEAIVHCKACPDPSGAFKRWVKVAVLHELDESGKVKRVVKVYASTYLQMPGHDGLEHCQSRSDDRMHFHHNLSLTAVSVAKAMFWYSQQKEERGGVLGRGHKAPAFQ